MGFQYYGFTVLLVWLQFAGLAAFFGPRFGSWAIGRSCGVLLISMVMFFIEHFIGLGSLKGAWAIGAVLSVWYIWKKWPELREKKFLNSEVVFGLALAYGIFWKFCFPSIYPSAERVTDLYFISNYIGGDTLPPLDLWYPPYRFDFYYAFQHYAAALLGRAFGLPGGLTYNVAFALLMAFPITLAWDIAGRFVSSRWSKLLLVAALTVGGTGASVFTHFIVEPPTSAPAENMPQIMKDIRTGRMWASARLIGQYDQIGNTEFAKTFFPRHLPTDPTWEELPLENFGYQYFVGDYHPPLGGFFLLLLAVGLIMGLEIHREGEERAISLAQQALLVLTVPAVLATNTWVYPLQGLLVVSWIAWRQWRAFREKNPQLAPSWPVLGAAAAAGFFLMYPFLKGMGLRTLETPIDWVAIHSPLIPLVALLWPLLVLLWLGLFWQEDRRPAMFFAVVFGVLLLLSEFVFINDPSIGRHERTNTVMKWWGWIWTGGLVAIAAPLLGAKRAWVRRVTGVALAGTLVYAIDTVDYLVHNDMRFFGMLTGDVVYTENPMVRDMFRYLATAPYGIVLENQYTEAYHDGGVYGTFAAKPILLGWPAHLRTWHGKVEEVTQRRNDIRAFYKGGLANPSSWLLGNNVEYIVWNARDSMDVPDGTWQRLNSALDATYAWHVFGFFNNQPLGIWVRRH